MNKPTKLPVLDLGHLALDLWDQHRPRYPARYTMTFDFIPTGGAIATAEDDGFSGHLTINVAHPDLRSIGLRTRHAQRLAVSVAAVLLSTIPRLPRNGPIDIPVSSLDLGAAEQAVQTHLDAITDDAITEAETVLNTIQGMSA